MGKIGSLGGKKNLIDADYDIDACNDEIAEMFRVKCFSIRNIEVVRKCVLPQYFFW